MEHIRASRMKHGGAPNMRILALDTAGSAASVAVLDLSGGVSARDLSGGVAAQGERLIVRFDPSPTGHAERLMTMITEAIGDLSLVPADLDRIAVSLGPGSFTGVRIAVATARGLAFALSRPVIGVSSLEAIAAASRAAHPGLPVIAAIDAKRDTLYLQGFDHAGTQLGPARAVPLAEAAALVPAGAVLTGSGADILADLSRRAGLATGPVEPDRIVEAATIARIAAARTPEPVAPEPIYLRPPDAKPQTRLPGLLAPGS